MKWVEIKVKNYTCFKLSMGISHQIAFQCNNKRWKEVKCIKKNCSQKMYLTIDKMRILLMNIVFSYLSTCFNLNIFSFIFILIK